LYNCATEKAYVLGLTLKYNAGKVKAERVVERSPNLYSITIFTYAVSFWDIITPN
jgi:hypothetical protein